MTLFNRIFATLALGLLGATLLVSAAEVLGFHVERPPVVATAEPTVPERG